MSEEAIWKREGHLLQEAAGSISTLRKEICKETEIDVSIQQSIKQKIESLKQNATQIANRLENQKHKNAQLDTIIRYMQGKIEQQKLMEATNRDNISFQSIVSLQARYKKLQYDLSHMSGKLNRLCQNVDTKKSKISQNRTERVIDSGIFRNIQKELITSQFKFKKLLIQKIKYQSQYQKLLSQYQDLKKKVHNFEDTQRENTKQKTNKKISRAQTQDLLLSHQKKFIQIQAKQSKLSYHNRTFCQNAIDTEIQQQQQKQMIIIQKLLSELRLQSCEQLLNSFENIEKINDSCFNQMNNFNDQIGQIERYLSSLQQQKKGNKIKFYQEKKQPTKNKINTDKAKEIKIKMKQIQQEIQTQVQNFTSFLTQQEFKEFQKKIDLEPIEDQTISGLNLQQIADRLKKIEENIHDYLRVERIRVGEEQQGITSRAASQQKLLDMLNRVKYDECMKVMKKEQFKDQYNKLMKVNSNSKKGKNAHSTSKLSNAGLRK